MRLTAFLGAGLSLASLFSVAFSAVVEEVAKAPEIIATAAFPPENTFNHVVNGQQNLITLSVENKSGLNVTLVSISGSLHNPDTNKLLKNLTAAKYGLPLIDGVKLQIPYQFYSEFKTGDQKLNIWLEHEVDGKKYIVEAYESIVTVIEPAVSIFDFKMFSTYIILLALFGGAGYYTYLALAPPKKKAKKAPVVSAPVGTVTATGAGGYQEEWIPEHHLKKTKAGSKKSGALSGPSGDELSGAEASGTEGKKRKGRK